ncbi:MAG: phenylacetate--CoA ligase family protein [Desulfobacteraceae bacterium]
MDRNMFNPEMEAITPHDQMLLEQDLLLEQIRYVYDRSEMYKEKFKEVNLAAGDIKTVEDLSLLPFTGKNELRQSQKRKPPFGDFLAASSDSLCRIHRTSGTTGSFVYTALTAADADLTHDCGARSFWAAGLRPHHRVVHCLNYCMWMGGYSDHANLERTGATVLPFGVGNSRLLVRVIKEAGISAISSTPSYPKYLEPVVREELGIEPSELGLRLGLFGGEPGLDNPTYRSRIETTWGMRAQNANYGVSDVLCNFASVCEDNNNLHFMGQGALLVQLVDPVSRKDIPLEEGVVGELVLTHLKKEAQPLIRYRTSDLMEILETGPCVCGRTGFRFRIAGRADDMLHVKGINVFPNGVAKVLEELFPDVTGEFQIVVSQPPPHTYLDIKVEHGEAVLKTGMAALKERVRQEIKDSLNFAANIELVPPDSIERTKMGKAIRVVRMY